MNTPLTDAYGRILGDGMHEIDGTKVMIKNTYGSPIEKLNPVISDKNVGALRFINFCTGRGRGI